MAKKIEKEVEAPQPKKFAIRTDGKKEKQAPAKPETKSASKA